MQNGETKVQSFLAARQEVRGYGCTLTKKMDGEYRVNFSGGSEATAYYTNDLADAVGTARLMAAERHDQESAS